MQELVLTENDLTLNYMIYGSGEPVVLLHGFGEDSAVWSGFIPTLGQQYQLIVPDLRGSGKSTGDMSNVSMESLADDVAKILEKENIHDTFMIGHSMGGYITLAYAERYPHKLKGLGLFHSTAFADSDEKKAARIKNADFIRKYGSAKFIEQSTPNLFSELFRKNQPAVVEEFIERYGTFTPTSLVAYTEAMMNRPDRTNVLKNFNNPVLLIMGEFDNAVPLEQGLKLCQIADFTYIYIATQSGHMGMLEEPEFCLKALQDFLSGS